MCPRYCYKQFRIPHVYQIKYIVFRLKTIPNTATFVGTLLMLNTARKTTNKMKHGQTRNGHQHVKHGQTQNGHEHVKHGQTRNGLKKQNTDKHGSQTHGQPARRSTTQLRKIRQSVRSHESLQPKKPMSSRSARTNSQLHHAGSGKVSLDKFDLHAKSHQ